MNLPIYLDNHATTMVDPRVVEAMIPCFSTYFGNPSSYLHDFGRKADELVTVARASVAGLIGAKDPDRELIFTSGATESINLGLRAAAAHLARKGRHLITTAVEHKAVLNTCKYLETQGFTVTYLPVDRFGLVSPGQVSAALRDDTILVAVMAANNEVGALNPVAQIGTLLKDHQALFFVDAAQAVGKIPVSVKDMGVDMLSLSAHKFHGPKGVGALYVRRHGKVSKPEPLFHGGGQERNIRSGTLNVPGIVGLGVAADIAREEMPASMERIKAMRDHLERRIEAEIEEVVVNGHREQRLPGNLNVSFTMVEGEGLALRMKETMGVSTGSACSSDTLEPSYVLMAMGLDELTAHSSIRMGLSKFNTMEEMDLVADRLAKEVPLLRSMSPLWQMKKDGVDLSTIHWTEDHH